MSRFIIKGESNEDRDMPSLIDNERGVSKVVGVVLLLGITMLLVAGVATVTTGVAGETPTQQQVDVQQSAFSFELDRNETYSPSWVGGGCPGDGSCLAGPNDAYVGDQLTVTLQSGSNIPSEDLRIRAEGAEIKFIDDSGDLRDHGAGEYHSNYTFAHMLGTDTVSTGDSVTLVTNYGDYAFNSDPYTPHSLLRDASVQIIYEGDDTSYVLAEWEGPRV